MTALIQQIPRGLLSLLGLKTGGQNPEQLSPVVSGCVELLEMYLQNNVELYAGQLVAPALGSNLINAPVAGFPDLSPGVPAAEFWYVHNYQAVVRPGAGVNVTLQPFIYLQAGSLVTSPPLVATGVAGPPAWVNPGGFKGWISPGTRFGFLVNANTGAIPAIEIDAYVTRLRI